MVLKAMISLYEFKLAKTVGTLKLLSDKFHRTIKLSNVPKGVSNFQTFKLILELVVMTLMTPGGGAKSNNPTFRRSTSLRILFECILSFKSDMYFKTLGGKNGGLDEILTKILQNV